jgi:hypothetical protein
MPLHTLVGLAAGDSTGLDLTVMVTVEDPVQPAVVPVTVYTVVVPGVTLTGVPDKLPGIQL